MAYGDDDSSGIREQLRPVRCLLFIPMILFAVTLLAAQLSQTPVSSVEGFVLREGTNEGVRGASVVAVGGPEVTSAVTTDDSGHFKFLNLAPGSYRFSAKHSAAYMPNLAAKRYAVTAGQEIKGVVIYLRPMSSLSGRILAPNGNPVANVSVQLLEYMYVDGRRMLVIAQQSRTNSAGEYQFTSVRPNDYVIGVELREPFVPVYFPGVSDADAASAINLPPGANYAGIDLTLTEQDALHIRGRLIDGLTGAAPSSSVFAILSPRERRTSIAGSTVPRKISVAVDGSFAIDGVPPGYYDVILTLGDGAERRAARTSLDLRMNIDDIRLVLQPVFEIRGRVMIDGAPGSEKYLVGAKVSLDHQPYITQVNPRPAEVQRDGSFIMSGVMPGDYRVHVTRPSESYIEFAQFGGADILRSTVHIDATNGQGFDIRLKPNTSSLDVAVYDNNNAPVEFAQVVLVPEYPDRERLDQYQVRATDASGSLHFTNIAPGNYKLFAWESLEAGKWQDSDFIRRNEDLGTPVHIGENASEHVNLKPAQPRR